MRMEKKNTAAEKAKRGAAGMARATHGRARTFKDRKKEAARKACRKKLDSDE